MKLAEMLVKGQLELTKPIADGTTLEISRNFQDKIGKLMHFAKRRDVILHKPLSEDARGALLLPRDELRGGVILYMHGGGYTCGTLEYAKGFASVLCHECGMRVMCVDYRLAPENPFPSALEDAFLAYKSLIDAGIPEEKIILAGESAGGGLCYALCLKLKEENMKQPAGIIAISPWCDLTLSGESYQHNKEADPSLTRERLCYFVNCYLGREQSVNTKLSSYKELDTEAVELAKNPCVSPLFADLSNLPPSLIFVGGDEILLSDAFIMSEKLNEYSSSANLIVKPGMWHAYLLYGLKSNRDDFKRINAFIRERMPKNNERKLRWMHLDNAAKIYPAAATSRWNNIYRLSATLNEIVDKQILQSALDVTVRRFPSIAVRLRRGAFWYYLEEIKHAPTVQEEKASPLCRMPFDDIRSCAIRVIVYKKRIAVEFFHATTDGNGALVFLKTLLAEYLTQKYGIDIPCENGVLDRLEEPTKDELRDEFPPHKALVGKSRQESNSYRIYGSLEEGGFCHVTTFMLNAKELLNKAHECGVTLTAYLAALFIKAGINLQNEDTPFKRQKPVKVLVPCDLRRVFGVKTLRNFALYSTPGVDPRLGEYSIDELAQIVSHTLHLDITPKNMSARIYTNVKDEENMLLKLTPLFLKNIVMKLVFLMVGEKKSMLSLSNIGNVTLPEVMKDYVDRFDVVLGVQSDAPYNAGVISYKNSLNINIIRNIKEPRLEWELYNVFKAQGIHVKVESNSKIDSKE